MQEQKRIIVLKSRQLGITTACTISLLDDVLFTRNLQALTIMQGREYAMAAFDGKVRFAWENLDRKLRDPLGWKVDTERANQLTFNFGAGIYSSYAIGTTGRSGTFQKVHISEFSKVCRERPLDAKEIITGTLPAVPLSGSIIIESTAEGEDGYFADYWRDAVEGKNGWFPLFLNWRFDDEEIQKAKDVSVFDLPVEFQKLSEMYALSNKEASYYYGKWLLLGRDWQALREQYPTTASEAFAVSGDKLFDQEIIAEYETLVRDGKKVGGFTIFEPYREGRVYVIGSDVAEGVGGDSSTAIVWKLEGVLASVVAIYASNTVGETDFAYVLKELGTMYGEAILAIERNKTGVAVIAKLREIYEEDRLYVEESSIGIVRQESSKYGFLTTSASKPLILAGIKQALSDRSLHIPSMELLRELRSCPRSEMTRVAGQVTKHYDLLMGAAIGYHARGYALARMKTKAVIDSPRLKDPTDPYSPI